ncbi:MAG: PilN domain-containing protein [Hyphomicrobiales bacterium]
MVTSIACPRPALANIDRILALEVSRATPFSPGDVLSGWYELPGEDDADQVGIAHVIARREDVWPAVERLRERGFRISRVVLRRGADEIIELNMRLDVPERPTDRLWRAIGFASGVLSAILAVTSGSMLLAHQTVELEILDQRLISAQAEAKRVREEVDAITASSHELSLLRSERAASVFSLAVWAELTRIVPDRAWLTGILIDGSEVTIDGNAVSAERLVALIDDSPLFEKVSFTGPVIKLPGGDTDRFSIRFRLAKPIATAELAPP